MTPDPTDVYTMQFLGVPMSQSWMDLYLWELLLSRYHVASIVELGTYCGGMTAYLGLQCFQRGIQLITVDRREDDRHVGPLFQTLNIERLHGDIFGSAFGEIATCLENKPVLLFCDNGNKAGEFHLFLPHLQSGDIIAVHDWGREFFAADVTESGLEMILKDECEEVNAITRFWRVL